MKFTLKINAGGKLHGWQDTKYEINGHAITECQKFDDGQYVPNLGFLSVFDEANGRCLNFEEQSWGTIEIARDAAELWCAGGFLSHVEIPQTLGRSLIVPDREEAYL